MKYLPSLLGAVAVILSAWGLNEVREDLFSQGDNVTIVRFIIFAVLMAVGFTQFICYFPDSPSKKDPK